jgi:16S rRNA (guanine527-N7)-methyltransferase
MENFELIEKYFNKLPGDQSEKYAKLFHLYSEWNNKINVISRKDMVNFNERHLLHSLSIAKFIQFKAGTKIMDVGTGGGFPGLPLAIMFPETEFLLVDSVGKKLKVINDIAEQLEISNVKTLHSRAEQVEESFDFIVSRAVARLPEFLNWMKDKIRKQSKHSLKNGILYLKGGDIKEELNSLKRKYSVFDLSTEFSEEYFQTKKLVHIYK